MAAVLNFLAAERIPAAEIKVGDYVQDRVAWKKVVRIEENPGSRWLYFYDEDCGCSSRIRPARHTKLRVVRREDTSDA